MRLPTWFIGPIEILAGAIKISKGWETDGDYIEMLQAIKTVIRRALRGKYTGLDQLDRKLEKYVDYDYGYFVELGANDGVTQSNSLYFEKYRKWRGLLVEPSP